MTILIWYWALYSQGWPNMLNESKNAVAADHTLKFLFDVETSIIKDLVQASMCYN